MNSIALELAVVRKLYIDSAPLIYHVEGNRAYLDKMSQVVRIIDMTVLQAYSSTLTLAEVLVMPLRLGNHQLVKAYQEILIASGDYELVAVTQDIAFEAADLRARYGLNTPDSIHAATAIISDCDAMLTNDRDMKRLRELSVLVLDELET